MNNEFQKKILKKKILSLPELPALPANVMTIMGALREEEPDLRKISAALSKDQVLVAEVLKLINSGFYSLRSEVTSVHHAVNLLGVNKVKEMLYAVSVMNILKGKYESLWLHSYSSYCLMEDFLREFPELGVTANLAFAMVLHDIGQVALRVLNPKAHQIAIDAFAKTRLPLANCEEQWLGLNHAEAGEWLLEVWDLGPEITRPIGAHHDSRIPKEYVREACLVQLVDFIDCSARGLAASQPSRELLGAAGIEEFDSAYWLSRQERVIATMDRANPGFTG